MQLPKQHQDEMDRMSLMILLARAWANEDVEAEKWCEKELNKLGVSIVRRPNRRTTQSRDKPQKSRKRRKMRPAA